MELAGFSISPAERLRLLKVLESTGQSNLKSPEKLKFLLAPVLVQGRAEQERFYELFDRYWDELQRPWEMPVEEAVVEKHWPGWLRWAVVVVVLGSLTWAAIELSQKENPPTPKVYFEHSPVVAIGDTVHFKNLSEHIDSSALRWEIVNPTTGQIELVDSQSFDLGFVVKNAGETPDREVRLTCLKSIDPKTNQAVFHVSTFRILCNNPPKIDTILAPSVIIVNEKPADSIFDKLSSTDSANFRNEILKIYKRESVKSPGDVRAIPRSEYPYATANFEARLTDFKDVQLNWNFGDSATATGSKVSHQFTKSGLFEVRLTATRSGLDGDCTDTYIHRISVGRDKAYLTAKILERDQVDAVVNFSWGTWILLGLLGLAIIWFCVKWAARKPPSPPDEGEGDLTAAAERFKALDKGPYFIPFRPQEGYVRMEPQFYRLADVLRQRQEGLRKNMDVPASLKKTIAEGGFPNLLSKADDVPTEYLFLIDEQTTGSHQSKLYSFLVDFLRKREVLGEVFYFKTEPIRFWNGQHPEGITPDQLLRLFPFNRLIVLGDGHGLLDPHQSSKTSAPSLRPDATAFFRQWKQRLLLTPMPVVSWTYREGALHSLFAIFPSDTEGLGETIKFLERGMDGEDLPTFASWCERLLEGCREPDLNYRRWRTANDHRDYLQGHPELYRWLCALAVYPKPDWSITLAIGRALSPLGVEVNYDNLLIVSRIPWLLMGDLSPRLRKELLTDLDSQRDGPEAERLAREAVQAELQAVETLVQGGHANQEHQINLALQNFSVAPDSPEMQASVRQLLALNLLTPKHLADLNQSVERHVRQNQFAQQSNQSNFTPQAPDIQEFLEENKPKPELLEKPFITKDFWWASVATSLFLLLFIFVWHYGGTEELARWAKPPPIGKAGCQEQYLYAYLLKKECVASDSAVLYNNAGVDAWSDFKTTANDSLTFAQLQKVTSLIESEKNFQKALAFRPDYQMAKNNLGVTFFNTGKILYDWALEEMDDLEIVPLSPNIMWDNVLPAFRLALPFDHVAIDALHCIGLVHFYADRQDSALIYYNRIRERTDSVFFDTLQMYPNLQSLLARNIGGITERIAVSVTDAQTGRPLRGVMVISKNTRGQTDPSGKIFLEIPLGESRTYDFTKKGYRPAVQEIQPTAYKLTFTVQMRSQLPKIIQRDMDKDGVPDSKDKCPKEPGDLKNAGCPIKDQPAQSLPPGDDTPQQQPPSKFIDPQMVFVKGGTFRMGCDEKRDGGCEEDALPVHEISLSDFAIGKYEVTNEEYAAFLNDYGLTSVKDGEFKGQKMIEEHEWGIAFRSQGDISKAYYEAQKGYEKHPVINVTWYGSVAYAEWLSEKTGMRYRLPTEAEWEYGARGGRNSQEYHYAGGNDMDEVAWNSRNSRSMTQSVGSRKANDLEIFDMSGNVAEWCSDWYRGNYYKDLLKGTANNPPGPDNGSNRILRGGDWYSNPERLSSGFRKSYNPDFKANFIGFRLVREENRASGF